MGVGVREVMDSCMRTALRAQTVGMDERRFVLPWKRRSHSSSSGQSFSTNVSETLVPPPELPPELPPNEEAPQINIPSSMFATDWSKMVDNPFHSDVVFKLATKTYHAHRYVLASGSDVMRQLLGVGERVRGECLEEGWSKKKVTQDGVNSGLLEGFTHVEERITEDWAVTEMTFDPDLVSEVALSRVLTFLYTGVVELNKDSEGLEETIKTSELLNLPELRVICQNAKKGEEFLNPSIGTWLNARTCIAKQLFVNKPLFSDVSFRVEGVLVHAHRLVLCARCEVMAAMLSGAFQESQVSEIEMPDTPLDAFLLFLEYLYTDSVRLKHDNCTSVLELANRYMMDRLKALCELYIVEKVSADFIAKNDINVVDLLLMSQLHNAAQLSSWCLHFISSNYVVFENKPEEFSRLTGSNSDYVREHRWPPLSYLTVMEEYQRKHSGSVIVVHGKHSRLI